MTRADILLTLLSLCLLAVLYSTLWGHAEPARQARIIVGSEQVAVLDLTHDQLYHVPGTLGDSVVEIKNHQARFLSSPCQNKVCVHSGWLQQGGELAACLPNHVALMLSRDEEGFDAINF